MKLFKNNTLFFLLLCLVGLENSLYGMWPFKQETDQELVTRLAGKNKGSTNAVATSQPASTPQSVATTQPAPTTSPSASKEPPSVKEIFAQLKDPFKELAKAGYRDIAKFLKNQWQEHGYRNIILVVVPYLYRRWSDLVSINAVLDGYAAHKRNVWVLIHYYWKESGEKKRIWNCNNLSNAEALNSVKNSNFTYIANKEKNILEKYKKYLNREGWGIVQPFVNLLDTTLLIAPYIPNYIPRDLSQIPTLGLYLRDTKLKLDSKIRNLETLITQYNAQHPQSLQQQTVTVVRKQS